MRQAPLCGMLRSVSSKGHKQREGEGAVGRQGHLIAVLGVLLIGCAVLLVFGCAGVRSDDPQEEQQGHTEATKKEQTRSPEATASEEARCEGTRTFKNWPAAPGGVFTDGPTTFTTNDLSGCPEGGPLSGTDKPDFLDGKDGDDQIRGLGAGDLILGRAGNDVINGGKGDDGALVGYAGEDVIYGGPGDDVGLWGYAGDDVTYGGDGNDSINDSEGEDVIYGGDGNDRIYVEVDGQRDKLYCGKGKDRYLAFQFDKIDYVDSSCEKKVRVWGMP
jgi:hemolysin type calcium-binding protein